MAIVQADPLRTVAFGAISGTYANLGTALTQNWRMFRCVNNTDGDMFLSIDGANDNFFVPANGFVLYDISTNAVPVATSDGLVFGVNTQFRVRSSTTPTKGAVWLEGLYARGV